MATAKADSVGTVLTNVITYVAQLAAVFHNYALIAEPVPRGLGSARKGLDATITTLNQVLTLLKDEAKDQNQKLFSDEGLEYVWLLATECAIILVKIEPIIVEACLSRKERTQLHRSRRQRGKKAYSKTLEPEVDLTKLKLDEKGLLEKLEKTRWSWAIKDIEECMKRLNELQLHLLLVFQVITVGALSKNM